MWDVVVVLGICIIRILLVFGVYRNLVMWVVVFGVGVNESLV